jgi:hypothetical protein
MNMANVNSFILDTWEKVKSEVPTHLIALFVGGVVVGAYKALKNKYLARTQFMTGTWMAEIYPQIAGRSGDPEKKDEVKCIQLGDLVEAEIRRIFPTKDNHKRYHFSGRLKDRVLFGHYYSTTDRQSYGTIFLMLEGNDDDHFVGNYIRASFKVTGVNRGQVDYPVVELRWIRQKIPVRSDPLP